MTEKLSENRIPHRETPGAIAHGVLDEDHLDQRNHRDHQLGGPRHHQGDQGNQRSHHQRDDDHLGDQEHHVGHLEHHQGDNQHGEHHHYGNKDQNDELGNYREH